jgi:hypothetical protein
MTVRIGAIVVAFTTIVGLVIALQGWRARGPDADVIGSMVRAAALADRGVIPQRGTLTDLKAFRPPGTSWLALPGVLLFDDPRLVELTGSIALYAGTLIGVFTLAHYGFGLPAAVLATILYGVSGMALHMAIQLWPKAHPFFAVWMAYCAVRWAGERRSRWFVAASACWLAGTYIHIEMAPFALILAALWWTYRPPISTRAVIGTVVIGLLMWSPYLAFEYEREFIDLRAQLLMRPLDARGGEVFPWCGDTPIPAQFASPGSASSLAARAAAVPALSVMTFDTRVPAGTTYLLLVLLCGLAAVQRGSAAIAGRALAISIVVVWVPLLLLTEPGINRMIGLWPLQLVVMTAFVQGRFSLVRQPRLYSLLAAALAVVVAVNSETLWHARGWHAGGWAGAAPDAVYAADFRSARCEEEVSR